MIFDCDGVILDTNKIKGDIFYKVVEGFGVKLANEFLVYHNNNGGLSRFEKFKYFFSNILKDESYDIDIYLKRFSALNISSIKNSNITEGFLDFIRIVSVPKYVVSASLEDELKEIFVYKNLARYFIDIFGSPKSKIENIKNISYKNKRVLLIGDSFNDFKVAKYYNFEFMFIKKYSLWAGYKKYEKYFTYSIDSFLDLNK